MVYSRTIEDTIKWLLTNFNIAIKKRKVDLKGKRLGSVSTASEPRFIWVSMVQRPKRSSVKRIFSLSRKFNRILEDVIANDKHSHFLDVDVPGDTP